MSMVWRYFDPYFRYEHELTGTSQAWSGHRLFVYDLVRNVKPKTIVELGTHHGNSFFAMCEALHDEGLTDTRITAIDTWEGDKHAGFYANEVFNSFTQILDKYYKWLTVRYIKSTFDEALDQVQNGEIELLHIDGLHTYEAVKKDFTQWYSKVADGGIIIFHDIHEFRDDFGVHQLWDELKQEFPTISFFHSHGLGVLIKGKSNYGALFSNHETVWQRYYHSAYDLKKSREIIAHQHEERQQLDQELAIQKQLNAQLEESVEKSIYQHQVDLAWAHKTTDEVRMREVALQQQVGVLTNTIADTVSTMKYLQDKLESCDQENARLVVENQGLAITVRNQEVELEHESTELRNLRIVVTGLEKKALRSAEHTRQLEEEVRVRTHELVVMSQSKFWKLRDKYLKFRWAMNNPVKAIRYHVLNRIPDYLQLGVNIKKYIHTNYKKIYSRLKSDTSSSSPSTISNVSKSFIPGQFYTGHITSGSIAVILHLYHEDMWEEIVSRLRNIDHDYYLLVSLTQGTHSKKIVSAIKLFKQDALVVTYENKGLDIIPFVKMLKQVPEGVKYILKIHTKKSPYNPEMGKRWFADLMDHVLLSPGYVDAVLQNLEFSDIGMIGGSKTLPLGDMFHSTEVHEPSIEHIYNVTGEPVTEFYWISGSMFWTRMDIFKPLTDKKITRVLEYYQPNGYRENGTVAHAMERYFGKLVYDAGKIIRLEPEVRYGSGVITTQVRNRSNHISSNSVKRYAFFHICCLNNYQGVVRELLDHMHASGLYDDVEKIYYSILGIPSDSFLEELRSVSKLECVYMSTDITDVEYPLLSYMYRFAKHNEGYFLYFHTKGVSAPKDSGRTRWRHILTQKTIDEHERCVQFLEAGCDVAGCGWKEHPHQLGVAVPYTTYKFPHFSGNFFWTTSEYLRTLSDPKILERAIHAYKYAKDIQFEQYRVMCEMWIGMNNPRVGVNGDFNVEYDQVK